VTVSSPEFGQDPSRANWVAERLTGEIGTVTGTVPAGFPSYARILHPVGEDGSSTTWADVAAAAGTRVHPLVQWHKAAPRRPGKQAWWSDLGPEEGNLPTAQLRTLLGVLSSHTNTPDACWFCLWIGYGWIHRSQSLATTHFHGNNPCTEQDAPPAYPRPWLDPSLQVRHPGREYLLGRGPVEAALGLGHRLTDNWFDA